MLVVRETQMQALRRIHDERWIDTLCAHLDRWFPLAGTGLSREQLRLRVARTVERAREEYGFGSRRDTMRYLNLAGAHGWDFEDVPGNAWMGDYLRDPTVSDPGTRLERLVRRCLADDAVAAHNASVRGAWATVADPFDQTEDELVLLGARSDPGRNG